MIRKLGNTYDTVKILDQFRFPQHKRLQNSAFRYGLVIYKSLFTKLVVAKKRKTYIHINTVKSNKTKQNTASKYATLL